MSETERRKIEHIFICAQKDVYPSTKTTWFEDIEFIHNSLPEININDISLRTKFLGHTFNAPIIISGMTGGHPKTFEINKAIASVAEELGIGFGVGSQRAALDNPKLEYTFSVVRKYAPKSFIIGNIGASQIIKFRNCKTINKLVKMIDADALAIHLNPLQEVLQPEGEPTYQKVLEKIRMISDECNMPIIVKETGAGISYETAKRLSETKIAAIDIGGAGGTSFAKVEYYRNINKNKEKAEISECFFDWGIPTAISICEVRKATNIPIIATGGIRCGIDATKALALNANIVGMALPILRAFFKNGERGIKSYILRFITELKFTMFLVGAKKVEDLRKVPIVISNRFQNWLRQRDIDLNSIREK